MERKMEHELERELERKMEREIKNGTWSMKMSRSMFHFTLHAPFSRREMEHINSLLPRV